MFSDGITHFLLNQQKNQPIKDSIVLKRVAPFFLLFFLFLPLTASAVEVGDTIPSFSGTDLDGNPLDLATIIGKQPLMLVFWASWCPNCKSEVPKVNVLQEKYAPQGMAFIGVNVGFNDSVERARSFMKSTKMTHPVLFDKKGAISYLYKVQGVPTIIVADKRGRVAFKNFGVPEISDEDFKYLNQ